MDKLNINVNGCPCISLDDVAKVASFFGGGGHVRAAGCTMKGTFHDCINNLSLHIDKQLRGEQD